MTDASTRAVTVAIVAVIAATLLAVGGAAAATGQEAAAAQLNTTTENATDENTTMEPGALLAGVIGVQQVEVGSEVDNRTYRLRSAAAAGPETRADVVAERLTEANQRLAAQKATRDELQAAREAGTISKGAYRAQTAVLAAQAATTEQTAEQLTRTASDLPDAVRERAGISESAIEQLRTEARELGGPETAAIARSIAGTTAPNPMAGRAGEQGDPGFDSPSEQRDGPASETPRGGQDGAQRATDNGKRGEQPSSQAGENSSSPGNSDDNSSSRNSGGASTGDSGGASSGDGGNNSDSGSNADSGSDSDSGSNADSGSNNDSGSNDGGGSTGDGGNNGNPP